MAKKKKQSKSHMADPPRQALNSGASPQPPRLPTLQKSLGPESENTKSVFKVEPLAQYAGKDIAHRRPKEVNCFSYDDEHRFHHDESSIRYYHRPQTGVDLSKGFDTFNKLEVAETGDHIDSLLRAIMLREQETSSRTVTEFVTWRGMMTKFLTAPYDDRDEWEMNATFFEGTIFIEEHWEHAKAQKEKQTWPTPKGGFSSDVMGYWGYKFEALSTLPAPPSSCSAKLIASRDDEIVSNKPQYVSIVETGFGSRSVMLGGEVDCLWEARPKNPDDPIDWVELKTNKILSKPWDKTNFERKLLKTWAQSFLLGVPKILFGFRDQRGILQTVQGFETSSVLQGTPWNPNLCIRFMGQFLEWLKATIHGEGVWRIRRGEKAPIIEVLRISEEGHGNVISQEFLQWRTSMTSVGS